ncbi:MAG: LysE family transporter [Pseudomonadota bacterium]
MQPEILMKVTILMAVIGLTPGPLSLLVFAHGAKLGFYRTVPFLTCGAAGYGILTALGCLFLGSILGSIPELILPARIISVLILLWFAWKIATDAPIEMVGDNGKKAMFAEGVMLQAVNPKAWASSLAVATLAMHSASHLAAGLTLGTVVFGIIFCALLIWAAGGEQMRHFLSDDFRRRGFNVGMASLLLVVGVFGLTH